MGGGRQEVTIIHLKNGKDVVVSLNEGKSARVAKANNALIVIKSQKNRTIDPAMIGDIEDTFVETAQQTLGENLREQRLGTGKECKGEYSINRELMAIASAEGKQGFRNLRDKKWREETKKQLYETTDKWCDESKGKCYCGQ